MNLVITMSRRFGTGASIIAKELSERLHIPVYDKDDVEHGMRENAFESEADAIRELYPKTGVTAYHMSGKIELASPMQYRKENVNMGLPSLSEYTLYRTDVKAVRSARAVLEEL